jgi:imidazolonepropionase-like amidohydrolase
MHMHVDGEASDRNSNLSLFVANGVTGSHGIMAGLPEHHVWQREVEQGHCWAAHGGSESRPRRTDDLSFRRHDRPQRRGRLERRYGQRARKVRTLSKFTILSRGDAYFAIGKEAWRLGLAVEGHVPAAITAEEASEAGQKSIEHFTGLSEAESDSAKADRIFAAMKRHRTWLCLTIVMQELLDP